MTVDYGARSPITTKPAFENSRSLGTEVTGTPKSIRTTGTNDGYLLRCCDHHWSDEHESITVRSDEAAFPVDVGGSMIGSVKKEPSSLRTTVSLGVS